MLLRMGYESRTHMDAAEMVDRVFERGEDARERVQSDTAELRHQRLKRVKWFQEWLTRRSPRWLSRTTSTTWRPGGRLTRSQQEQAPVPARTAARHAISGASRRSPRGDTSYSGNPVVQRPIPPKNPPRRSGCPVRRLRVSPDRGHVDAEWTPPRGKKATPTVSVEGETGRRARTRAAAAAAVSDGTDESPSVTAVLASRTAPYANQSIRTPPAPTMTAAPASVNCGGAEHGENEKQRVGAHRAEAGASGPPPADDALLGDDGVHRAGRRGERQPEQDPAEGRRDKRERTELERPSNDTSQARRRERK